MSDFDERVLLGMLLQLHPAPVTTDDLARALGGDHAAIRTEDALAGLDRDGLVNRLDRFVWLTRAAIRTDELAPI